MDMHVSDGAVADGAMRHDWTRGEILALMGLPFPILLARAMAVHRARFDPTEMQLSTLLSIKTGGCPEDCAYCPQSVHHEAGVAAGKLMDVDAVLERAAAAKAGGAARFCMGAAWRNPKDRDIEAVCRMVEGIAALGLESCATLGMLTRGQAERLKGAGLDYYNHNLDTSPEHYGRIITTRTYDDRLRTLDAVRDAGIHVCCGGIVGMGEGLEGQAGLIEQLANLKRHPESVPINMLVRVEGTPLGGSEDGLGGIEFVRVIAAARIAMPGSRVRLAAGREQMNDECQALCFLAGANSIFVGERLLTTPNPAAERDYSLLARLGMHAAG